MRLVATSREGLATDWCIVRCNEIEGALPRALLAPAGTPATDDSEDGDSSVGGDGRTPSQRPGPGLSAARVDVHGNHNSAAKPEASAAAKLDTAAETNEDALCEGCTVLVQGHGA